MAFGILTLATPNDYRKAIGLALSARISNPGVPIAVACSPAVRPLLSKYFDIVVDEDPTLRGFVHKVHLDRYSPFEDTFFFDSDVLLFKNLKEVVDRWADQPYTACGEYLTDGYSSFGLSFKNILEKTGKPKMAVIDGAGHAYFRKPGGSAVFDLAREVTQKHREYAGNIRYADEDVIDIVMTMLDLVPAPRHDAHRPEYDFFSRYLSAVPGTMTMDVTKGICHFTAQHSGKRMDPYMMHFAANEAPFAYARQLNKLFKKFDVDASGLYQEAINDYVTMHYWWPLKSNIKKALKTLGLR